MNPLLSIVIANYNYGRFLEAAIKSVVNQDGFDKCELIIVDGGSTDNSVEIIKKYANGLPPNTRCEEFKVQSLEFKVKRGSDDNSKLQTPNSKPISWWCSEKDGGQSEAFNKGFAHARGKYLTWLNADDIYLPGALKAVEKAFERCPGADWATCNFIRFRQCDKRIIEAAWGPHWVPFAFQGNGYPLAIFGPTVFWSRAAYDKVGPIDETLHYTMDPDYWRRLTVAGYKFVRVNHDCWAFRMHDESKTAEFDDHARTTERKARMQEETRLSIERSGYRVKRGCVAIRAFLRFVDGSLVRRLWRRWFLVGKNLEFVYDLKTEEE